MVRDNEYHKSTSETGFFVDAPEEDFERRQAIEEARRALDKIKEPMRSCLLLKQQGLLIPRDRHQFVAQGDKHRQFGGARAQRVCEGLREDRRQTMTRCLDEGKLQSYFDGELPIDMMESVTSHLASCATCAAAARELEEESALLTTAFAAEFENERADRTVTPAYR
jgi:hypothetical protein